MIEAGLQSLREQNESLRNLVSKLTDELGRERREGAALVTLISEKESSLKQLATGLHDLHQEGFILGERYRALADHLGESISILDISGRYVYANGKAAGLHGLQSHDMVGRHVTEILGPEYGSWYIHEVFNPVVGQGITLRSTKPFVKHGRSVLLGYQVKPLWDESSRVIGVMNITHDETARKNKQEHTLIEQGINLLSSFSSGLERTVLDVFGLMCLVDSISVAGIYLHDDEQKLLNLICHRNLPVDFRHMVRSYDSTSPEYAIVMRGEPWYDVLSAMPGPVEEMLRPAGVDHLAIIPMAHEHVINGCLIVGLGHTTVFSEADRIFFESIAWRLSKIVALFRAQERLHRAHDDLTATVSELRQKQQLLISRSKMESLGELSAGMAHEINQPLVIISLSVGNILHKLDEGQKLPKEYLGEKFSTMMHNIHRIRQVIDDIRTFARDEGSILIEQIDVRETLVHALSAQRDRFRLAGVRLTCRTGRGDLRVAGNAYKLEQVITNLLDNAFDAVVEREVTPATPVSRRSVDVRATRKKDTILLTVSDSGTGIAPDHLKRLFTPFFTTKAEGAGTGLGLPIAYGIVTDMGGEITVSSTHGTGSRFVVALPAV